MHIIVGLGNIGAKYEHTRHNVGFDVIDLISKKYNIDINREKFKGMCGFGNICNEKCMLLKPSTYMNLSGESVIEAVNFYKIPNENIIIIYDDISLDIGKIRIKTKGSSGGHNGIKNIICNLNSEEFTRIKIGIDSPNKELVSYVLGKFSKQQKEVLDKVFEISVEAVENIIDKGVQQAMNKYNGLKIQ
ncbi:peptidyl-tRNA hydrolase [Clostridium acetireducens DSM 10703]|jgi:PTH1 family peptidyl-tRNA hydrolase|uniref:Peptidyl-tRNA hydrolase n=1 Tax=Clostridium acetireducens DSM 10703 TaxID=1121290 RepID=A0A1E8EZI5_9CLOT|nr:aminoacyl-tRNA hydrolase [Clostridium acetireducens]OFI06577.1 peptidyl-tRNA hydrolase [Clostridium acetireducens DSM 10703]